MDKTIEWRILEDRKGRYVKWSDIPSLPGETLKLLLASKEREFTEPDSRPARKQVHDNCL